MFRDRPFNLKGGLWFFVSFRIFFSDNTRVRIYFILSRKAQFFFPEFHIRLYDKNSESDYFFFPPPKSEYFFQQHWESEYFFRKKTITPPFKLNGRSLIGNIVNIVQHSLLYNSFLLIIVACIVILLVAILYRDHVGFCVIVTFSSIHKLKWPVLLSYLRADMG